jgi:hypothetical protein
MNADIIRIAAHALTRNIDLQCSCDNPHTPFNSRLQQAYVRAYQYSTSQLPALTQFWTCTNIIIVTHDKPYTTVKAGKYVLKSYH